ncbi:hypothetical protein C8R48DRAFT_335231 [Suillus tomentosus]|nr:hypothetical protein C8R48DRAFT_335231 [Suillus tomentosus]
MKGRVITLCFKFIRDSLFAVVLLFPCTTAAEIGLLPRYTVTEPKFQWYFTDSEILFAGSILVSSGHHYLDNDIGMEYIDISRTPFYYHTRSLFSIGLRTCIRADPYITEPIVYLEHIISKPASRLRAVPHFI